MVREAAGNWDWRKKINLEQKCKKKEPKKTMKLFISLGKWYLKRITPLYQLLFNN
jgi:hypothetical protein